MRTDRRFPTRPAAWAALAVLGAWLFSPALTPVHVEGFSASIVSLGLHIASGHATAYDRLFPVNLEFFGLSRLGTSLAVALVARLFHIGGELAMRLTMWVGLVALLVTSWALVRRWTGASGPVVAAALLLLPGVAESAFFYNDNVLASALGVAGLVVLAGARRPGAAVAAGLLLGAGVVTRADVVLLAPAVPLMLLERYRREGGQGLDAFDWRRAVVMGAFVLGGAVIPIVGLLARFHATFLDVLHISTYVVVLWARRTTAVRHLTEVLYFMGLPGFVLAALGVYRLARTRDYLRLALLAGVPVLFNLVELGKLWEARQLLPLTPFVAALLAYGWSQLAPANGRFWGSVARPAFAALVLLVFVAPTRWLVGVDDGPRALRGRLWSVARWRQWQRAVSDDMRGVTRVAAGPAAAVGDPAGPPAPPRVVVTDGWNADRYAHLALQENGYVESDAGGLAPACGRAAELFQKGDDRVLHVRLHTPFFVAAQSGPLVAGRYAAYGAPCLAAVGARSVTLLATSGTERRVFVTGDMGAPYQSALTHADSVFQRAGYDVHVPVPLSVAELAAYADREARVARSDAARLPAPPRELSVAESDRLLGAQVPFSQ